MPDFQPHSGDDLRAAFAALPPGCALDWIARPAGPESVTNAPTVVGCIADGSAFPLSEAQERAMETAGWRFEQHGSSAVLWFIRINRASEPYYKGACP